MDLRTATRPHSDRRRYLLFWLALTAFSLFFSLAYYVSPHLTEESTRSVGAVLGCNALRFWSWFVLTPVIVSADRRMKRRWQHWAPVLVGHSLVGVVLASAHTLTAGYGCYLIEPMKMPSFFAYMNMYAANHILLAEILYYMVLISHYAIDYYDKYRDERLRSAVLEARVAQSELQALKMQLEPHFLFNALNSISSLVLEDPRVAVRMIARLGDFLRVTIDNEGSQEVSLQDELEFLRCYLEIEQVRFRDRLEVTFRTEPAALRAQVPNLILQPIVENAIKHGIAPTLAAGRIQVRARQSGRWLEVQVENDGPRNDPHSAAVHEGVGLVNTRERLHQLYHDDFELSLERRPEGGAVMSLRIPYRIGGVGAPQTVEQEA